MGLSKQAVCVNQSLKNKQARHKGDTGSETGRVYQSGSVTISEPSNTFNHKGMLPVLLQQ